ncbi:MAG TPA: hypothetical protein VNI20_00160 [Fimbriimonadaceae bacterium]|nr:hypothetical protein [Fimbriimonadaceae bacterium]
MVLFFAPNLALPPVTAVVQQAQTMEHKGLSIRYDQPATFDAETNTITFTGSVEAQYDLTIVRSDRLTLNYSDSTGVAEGGVVLTDPEAYMTTDRLVFDWKKRTGTATNVYVRAGNVRLWAEKLEIEPTQWTLTEAKGTLSRRINPNYKIESRTVRIYPGRYAIAEKVGFHFFGWSFGRAQEMRFDLDPRIEGFNLPSIANKKGVGLGVSWGSSFLLSENVALGANYGSFPHRLPTVGLDLTYMRVDPEKTFKQVKPADDLKEQFGDGWFDNVAVKSPLAEANSVSHPRIVYSIASKWNTSTFARPEISNDVSKPAEAIVETGGSVAGFGLRMNARVQSIRDRASSPFVTRGVVRGTLLTPVVSLGKSLGLQARLDAVAMRSEANSFGWARGLVSVLWSPINGITLGAGYSDSRTTGTPDFLLDRLLYESAYHLRADYSRGPYTFRYLIKYVPQTGALLDSEYEIALVAESLQPFITYRKNPSDFRIGIRFRIDDFVGRLQRRSVKREIDRPF